jgi:hypothetical protein
MSTTIKTTHRFLVALSLPKSVPALIVYAQGIVKRMTGNPSFPDSAPELAAVATAIVDLQTAEAAVGLLLGELGIATRNDYGDDEWQKDRRGFYACALSSAPRALVIAPGSLSLPTTTCSMEAYLRTRRCSATLKVPPRAG